MATQQAYNARAKLSVEGSELILSTNLMASPSDIPSFAPIALGMQATMSLSKTVIA